MTTPLEIARSKKKELILAVGSIFISALLGLAVLEIYFYNRFDWHDTNTQFDPELGWTHFPSVSADVKGKKFTYNEMGLRSAPVEKNRAHVLMAGDSVVWGHGTGDEETIPAVLDRLMSKQQVLNLGVAGYDPGQYYLRLKSLMPELNPDLVVATFYTGNDLEEAMQNVVYGKSKPLYVPDADGMKGTGGFESQPLGSIKLFEEAISKYSCPNLFSRSWTLRRSLFRSVQKRLCSVKVLSGAEPQYVLMSLTLKMKELADSHGADILFVLSPSQSDFKYDTPEKQKGLQPKNNLEIRDAKCLVGLLLLKLILKELNAPHVDGFQEFMKYKHRIKELYLDNSHLSPLGNRFMAEAIHGYILKNQQAFPRLFP